MSDLILLTPETYLELWYLAAEQEIGIAFGIADKGNVQRLQNNLYEARSQIADPRLKSLSLWVSADGKEAMIYKKEIDLEA